MQLATPGLPPEQKEHWTCVLREDNWEVEAPRALLCTQDLGCSQTHQHAWSGIYLFPALNAFPGSNLTTLYYRWNPSFPESWGLLSRASTWLWGVEMGMLHASKLPGLAPPACHSACQGQAWRGSSLAGWSGVSSGATSVLRPHGEVSTWTESSLWAQPGDSCSRWSAGVWRVEMTPVWDRSLIRVAP